MTAKRPTVVELQREVRRIAKKQKQQELNGDVPALREQAAFWRVHRQQFQALAESAPALVELAQSDDLKRFIHSLPGVLAEMDAHHEAEIGRRWLKSKIRRYAHPLEPLGKLFWLAVAGVLAALTWVFVQGGNVFGHAVIHPPR